MRKKQYTVVLNVYEEHVLEVMMKEYLATTMTELMKDILKNYAKEKKLDLSNIGIKKEEISNSYSSFATR